MTAKKAMKMNLDVCSKDIIFYNKCECGAITIKTKAGVYSCKKFFFPLLFPNVDLRKCRKARTPLKSTTCSHCADNYGLDLCSCGSGKTVGKCSCGSTKAAQEYGKYERIVADESLLA
jgi:hypothetical protein